MACSICRHEGHNRLTCPHNPENAARREAELAQLEVQRRGHEQMFRMIIGGILVLVATGFAGCLGCVVCASAARGPGRTATPAARVLRCRDGSTSSCACTSPPPGCCAGHGGIAGCR